MADGKGKSAGTDFASIPYLEILPGLGGEKIPSFEGGALLLGSYNGGSVVAFNLVKAIE